MNINQFDYQPDALEVRISELLVATADDSDTLIDGAVPEVLRLLREHLKMDVVFVSEFVDGQRVFKRVDAGPDAQVIAEGDSSPLEESFCQRVVDGRLPRLVRDLPKEPSYASLPPTDIPIGAHLSTPIVLDDGSVYGTLCCFSFAPNQALTDRDLRKLEMSAQLAAKKIHDNGSADAKKAATPEWELQPKDDKRGFR